MRGNIVTTSPHTISNRDTYQKEKCMINRLWYGNFHIPHINPRHTYQPEGFGVWYENCYTIISIYIVVDNPITTAERAKPWLVNLHPLKTESLFMSRARSIRPMLYDELVGSHENLNGENTNKFYFTKCSIILFPPLFVYIRVLCIFVYIRVLCILW